MNPPCRILVIDDVEDNVELVEEILTDCEVQKALSGVAGLELATRGQVDLILLDLQMPGMDGFAVLERLREDPRTASLPVVLLTAAFRDAGSIERGLALGASEYLTKPIQADELRVRIRSILRAARAEKDLEGLRKGYMAMLLHDLRTPLESVRLAVSMLERTAADDRSRQLVNLARGGLLEANELIDALVEGHRLESVDFAPDLTRIRLTDLVAQTCDRLDLLARQRHFKLVASVPESLAMRGDSRLLTRVLSNLIGNALKYADPGPIEVSGTIEGPWVHVDVIDQGPGMTPEARAHAFDRFYQAAGHGAPRTEGFGLGLAFCKEAMERQGGRIAIANSPQGGTRVRCTLPGADGT